MIGPPAKATSMRTESGESGNGYDLRENAVDGVGVDKSDLQAEQAATGSDVDQLRTGRGEIVECCRDVVHLVGDVMDAGAALGEEAPHRGVLAGRGEQLEPAPTDEYRGRLDTLVVNDLAVLERAAEEAGVGLDGFVEIDDGKADVVDTVRLHPSMLLPGRGWTGRIESMGPYSRSGSDEGGVTGNRTASLLQDPREARQQACA